MSKKKDLTIFDVKPRAGNQAVIATSTDLILVRVDIETVKGHLDEHGYTYRIDDRTLSGLITLQMYLKRGFSIVSTTPHEGHYYRSIIYTLYKPIEW